MAKNRAIEKTKKKGKAKKAEKPSARIAGASMKKQKQPKKSKHAPQTKKIKLDHITKIEGHAKLNISIEKGVVRKVKLDVNESARFFESLVLCRRYDETSPLTSRICGVCSPSHSLTSILATEDAFGVKVSRQTDMLRELLLYSSIFQNHAVHLFVLALPDYLGYESVIEMASKYKDEVLMGLKIKQLGNELVTVVGGREIHPITAVIGGFSVIPDQSRLDDLLAKFRKMRPSAVKTVELFSKLKYPDFRRKTQAFAFVNDDHSFYRGKISCIGGVCIPQEEYASVFEEHIKAGSSAKVVLYKGKPFFNGALARLLVNGESLSQESKKYLNLVDFNNPFHNNLAQAIEILHCFDRIIDILEKLRVQPEEPVRFTPKAGRGIAYTEAPRGLLVHDYTYDENGHVMKANIITPTAQNLKQMEEDLRKFLPPLLDKPEPFIRQQIEMLIRAYDPCFSCSAHFLELKIERE